MIPIVLIAFLGVVIPATTYPILFLAYYRREESRRKLVEYLFNSKSSRKIFQNMAYQETRAEDIQDDSNDSNRNHTVPKWLLDHSVTAYIYPLSLCIIITLISLLYAGPIEWRRLLIDDVTRMPVASDTLTAGFVGAYIWSMYECISRFRSLNLTPGSLHIVWLRLLVGISIGWLFSMHIGLPPSIESSTPYIAFTLGAFPLQTVRRWMREVVSGRLQIRNRIGDKSENDWNLLQGIDHELIDRLADADINTPTALAASDPFMLFIRTNIAWKQLLDLIDQAIMVQYVGTFITDLRVRGIRGAIEGAVIWERIIHDRDQMRVKENVETVSSLSKIMNQTDSETRNLIRNMHEDAQVNMIWNLWYDGAFDDAHEK